MSILSVTAANRLGFIIIGTATTLVSITMLSAAFDLLNQSHLHSEIKDEPINSNHSNYQPQKEQHFCNPHSASQVLLANTLPSLCIKILYPFLLVSVPPCYKIVASALLGAGAYTITGLFTNHYVILCGVVCSSLSNGIGESNVLAITPIYGDESLSGWSTGSGLAAFFGSLAYALLRMVLPIKHIMMVLLVVPVILMSAYFFIITPLVPSPDLKRRSIVQANMDQSMPMNYILTKERRAEQQTISRFARASPETSSFKTKLLFLCSLSKYFLPLFLVYFAEYFINQGLVELIYYPEISQLDHAAQYRWFQVAYQFGVMISRSSLELIKINNIWAMSLLQFANAVVIFVHAARLIYLPSFYLVVALIVYEGLLGGFTYVNAFYRVKKETLPQWREFSISAVTVADVLGMVVAGIVALPVHRDLCQLYD